MMFVGLVHADIYRDGGSYRATLSTTDGAEYHLWLQRSRMPDSDGLHHRWLFAYSGPVHRGPGYPPGALPVVTGSDADRQLIESLRTFIKEGPGSASENHWRRLTEMLRYITVREPCSPEDLRDAGFLA